MKIFKKSKLILNEKASEAKISEIKKYINSCDAFVIGAGAGLSSASGLTYSGERFENKFSDFIERYGMKDMYSAGFYPFSTQEEKWAYWSRHIFYNRYDVNATKAYTELFELIKNRNYFVITTNVDHQFWMSGLKTIEFLLHRVTMVCSSVQRHVIKSFTKMRQQSGLW